MDTQILEKLLLLIAGGVLTALGAWINDVRGERRRKKAKLEEAYLAWLNTEYSVLSRLKELAKLAEREPESLQSHDLLLEKFERLHSDLQNLVSALNQAFIYERDRKKKALVEVQSLIYTQLAENLNIIILHQRTHLDLHTMIDETNNMVFRFDDMKKSDLVSLSPDLAEKITELQGTVQLNRDDVSNYLSNCSSSLSRACYELLSLENRRFVGKMRASIFRTRKHEHALVHQ
jgi:hypothetical protein